MAIPTRSDRPGTFFITSGTHRRRRLFQLPANAALFIETLQHYRREGHFKLHAFVVMPDHIHLLLTPEGITLERAMGFIKGGFSHKMDSKFPVWQRGFSDHRIRDAEEFAVRKHYIHQNPVEAHLVEKAEFYPFSSAYRPQGDMEEKSTSAAEAALLGSRCGTAEAVPLSKTSHPSTPQAPSLPARSAPE